MGKGRDRENEARFEITDKTIDFLGFKTLKDLWARLARAASDATTRAIWRPASNRGGISRPYEFGDTLNLDISGTLFNAVRREGSKVPIELDYPDLMVHQTEYQSSCATVLMLDCSHSMILYGEDRFTPAKKVALALSHLIRTQYPGDSLHLVLFHDSAEEMPLGELARVQVGPITRIRAKDCASRGAFCPRQKKDMRQIVMITDGKPSALTLEDGRIYKNAFGLDPLVVTQTLEEVGRCRAGHFDQHVHAGQRLQPDSFRAKSDRTLPRQGLLHHSLYPRPIPADGLHAEENPAHPLSELVAHRLGSLSYSFSIFSLCLGGFRRLSGMTRARGRRSSEFARATSRFAGGAKFLWLFFRFASAHGGLEPLLLSSSLVQSTIILPLWFMRRHTRELRRRGIPTSSNTLGLTQTS